MSFLELYLPMIVIIKLYNSFLHSQMPNGRVSASTRIIGLGLKICAIHVRQSCKNLLRRFKVDSSQVRLVG